MRRAIDWMQNTHSPFEVPEMYSALYDFPRNPRLNVFNGMVSVVDSAVGNLTAALKARPGAWSNTIVRRSGDAPHGPWPSLLPRNDGKCLAERQCSSLRVAGCLHQG
eukprot:SAG11_NODE_4821_length_1754_cov_1.427795_2_plen_107_part_00